MMKVCSECQRCYEDAVDQCTEMHGPLSELRCGTVSMIPGYQLDQRVSTGLRGDVFWATRLDCGQSCLIRLVTADVETSDRFLKDARLITNLFHPNLSAVYESGTCDSGELFVVSEDLEDCETLRNRLDSSGPPNLLESIRIVRVAAETLHELHGSGVVHRAVCPENILISTDHSGENHVRFQNIDFGGAGQRSIISNKFLIDTEVAAIRYFAPEQCAGEPASARSDVYSLGILLYELIAGSPPFDADRASGVIEHHRSSRPPEVKIDNFDLRMLITHALMESLGKRADMRQASADLFARQLRHIEQLATHVSTPPPAVTIVPPPAAKHQALRVISIAETDHHIPTFQESALEMEPTYTIPYEAEVISSVVPDRRSDPGPRVHIDSLAADPARIKQADFAAVCEQTPNAFAAAAASDESSQSREPKLIRWNDSLDDLPSIEETLEVLHAEGDTSAAFEEVVVESVEIPPQTSPVIIDEGVRSAELAYRSHVPRANRTTSFGLIGLNLESPASTGLGRDHANPRKVHFENAEIFSSVQGLSAVRFSRLRRGIGVGAIAGLLVLAFTFRGDIVEAFTPFDIEKLHPSQSHLAAIPAPATIHSESDTIYSTMQAAQNDPEPVADSAAGADVPAAARINGPESKRAERPAARENVQPPTPRRISQALRAQDKPAPIQPSTLVITYADPKKKSSERAKERDPFVAPKREPGLTRPRVVANPNP